MTHLALLALGLLGCVMPPDADYVQTPPDVAPRIEAAAPAPYLGIVVQSADCGRLYTANITDPDIADTLYWRWFVDYHRDTSQISDVTKVERDPLHQTIAVNFFVPGNDERFGALTTEPHVIELLVADRPFAANPHQDPTSPTPGRVTWVTWTVRWSTQKPATCD
jgi:hypothetical protein